MWELRPDNVIGQLHVEEDTRTYEEHFYLM
jgi:hypothetical protein